MTGRVATTRAEVTAAAAAKAEMPAAAAQPDKMAVPEGFKVWEGVYASFAEAPAAGLGHASPIWQERSKRSVAEMVRQVAAGETLDYSVQARNAIMPIVVATELRKQPRVRVLDFGGGLGTAYMVLSSALKSDLPRVDFSIVELEDTCGVGREFFSSGSSPVFLSEFPEGKSFDIVQACSVLQYIDDWRAAVRQLADYRARYLVLGDLLIGNVSSYATLQNHYGSRIRTWMLNADDFISEVQRHGYQLVLRFACGGRILGSDGPLPMSNFPPERRIDYTAHLLFANVNEA